MHAAGRNYTYNFLPGCLQQKLFISGSRDEFADEQSVKALVDASPNSSLIWVMEADHFFVGKLDQVQIGIRGWMEANFLSIRERSLPARHGS